MARVAPEASISAAVVPMRQVVLDRIDGWVASVDRKRVELAQLAGFNKLAAVVAPGAPAAQAPQRSGGSSGAPAAGRPRRDPKPGVDNFILTQEEMAQLTPRDCRDWHKGICSRTNGQRDHHGVPMWQRRQQK